MALGDFFLSFIVLPRRGPERLFRFGQLDFHIAKGLLQLFVFKLSESEHLPVLVLGPLLPIHSETATSQFSAVDLQTSHQLGLT